jgi:hypothetical protein
MNYLEDQYFRRIQALESERDHWRTLALAAKEAGQAMMKVLPACPAGFNDGCPWCLMQKALVSFPPTEENPPSRTRE